MTDAASQLAALRALRGTVTDPAQAVALDALIAQLEVATVQPSSHTHTMDIRDEVQVGVAVAGDIHGNIYLDGRRADQAAKLLAGYLRQLRGRCGSLPLEGVRKQKQVDDVLAVRLDHVYTQLAVEGTVIRERFAGDDLRTLDLNAYLQQHVADDLLPWLQRASIKRPLTASERNTTLEGIGSSGNQYSVKPNERTESIVEQLQTQGQELKNILHKVEWAEFYGPRLVTDAIVDNHHLVLLGEPGSGKSTALRYLAFTLAEAALEEHANLPAQLAGWERLSDEGKLVPVFVPLLPFARLMANNAGMSGSAVELWHYLADQLEPGNVRTGLAEAVHAELSAGRVLLMLDGLDEVAGEESRRKVVRAVRQFAEEQPQCRIVVSCRVRAYEGEQNRAWQLHGWPTATLAEWHGAQIQHFIRAWYQAAVDAGGLPETQLAARVDALQRATAASQDLQRLASRPLLLTIMALVHLNDGRLPEDRVTLYSRCIDILLGQWELRGKEQSQYGSLMDYIGLPDRDVQRLRPLLTKAAFAAHQASSKDSPGSLGRDTLRAMVMAELEQLEHPDPYRGAQKFLDYTDHRAGLLQASSAGDAYVFPHLTFQEYLAGLALTSGVGVVERIMQHRSDDRWRVPIFLGVGDYVSTNKLETPYQLLNELRVTEDRSEERRQRDLLFAAELATDVGWDRLEQGGAAFRRLRRDLALDLVGVVEGTVLPAKDRVRSGELLGELGDPRPGVCDLNIQMVVFPTATFLIGEAVDRAQYRGEKNDTPVTIATFELARYPVTNAQYGLFMANDGYKPERGWWDDVGRAWLQKSRRTKPPYWNHDRFGESRPNHPVVTVTWYEASAFCRWLTQHLNDGYIYRLPSEAEWEYAARGTTRRPYPWGDEQPDGERANFNNKYNGTTAVGCFPTGTTDEGLVDMAGNVWEWTASVHGDYAQGLASEWQAPADVANKHFTLRGGGWSDQPINLRASGRYSLAPDDHYGLVGFRLARHLPED